MLKTVIECSNKIKVFMLWFSSCSPAGGYQRFGGKRFFPWEDRSKPIRKTWWDKENCKLQ